MGEQLNNFSVSVSIAAVGTADGIRILLGDANGSMGFDSILLSSNSRWRKILLWLATGEDMSQANLLVDIAGRAMLPLLADCKMASKSTG